MAIEDQPNTLMPKLRFPEFGDEPGWEEKALQDVCEVNPQGNGLPDCFVYIDLESVEGGILLSKKRFEKEDAPSRAQRNLKNGDVVFQIVRPYQRNNLFIDFDGSDAYVASTGYAQLRAYENAKFLYQLIHTDPFVEKVIAKCTGSSYPAINSNDLVEVSVSVPSLAEQSKIAACLTSLDELIAAEVRKLEGLRNHKKGLMQQLFPCEGEFRPRLRFPEFDDGGEWKVKKVGDVFEVTRGEVLAMPLVKDQQSSEMPYPVYSSQTKNNGLAGFYSDFLYENAITWTTDGANAGQVNYRNGKFYCTNVCGVLLSDNGHANPCVAALLDSVTRSHVSYVGNPKLMNGVMAKISIPFPSIKEQQRIAACLSSVDTLIAAQSRKLDALRDHKKGLMQQLFPSPEGV